MLRYANIGLIARFPVGLGKNLASSFNNVSYKFFYSFPLAFFQFFDRTQYGLAYARPTVLRPSPSVSLSVVCTDFCG